MRIVVTGYHPLDPARIAGGVEAITLRLAEGLEALGGHEIHVVCTRPEVSRRETRAFPGRTVHLLPRARLGNLTLMARDRARLQAVFRELRPDVIHAHSTTEFALAALESGAPAVVSVHGIVREETRLARGPAARLRGFGRDRLEDRVLARVRDVVVVSPYVLEVFGHLFTGARTHMIETSVSDIFFETPRSAGAPAVLFAGLILPRKGVLDLVAAARELLARHPGAEVRLAGDEADPAYAARVKEAIAAAGLAGRVRLLGGLSPAALASEYARASVMALPSYQETAPVAIQEAMASGVPVVATDVGGNRHLVEDGVTGRVVPARDVASLASALDELLSDPAKSASMGERGRSAARARFSCRAVAERTLALYREVVARGAGAR